MTTPELLDLLGQGIDLYLELLAEGRTHEQARTLAAHITAESAGLDLGDEGSELTAEQLAHLPY